jgi:hypothetical protein
MRRSFLSRIGLAFIATLLVLWIGAVGQPTNAFWGNAVAQARPIVVLRRIDPVAIATQIYQQYPDLPCENTYRQADSGNVNPEDTLVSRFIRYHLYVKDRPANFRFDWKLSLADYLGAFDSINPDNYPSADTLTENPASADQTAIQALSRTQRNQLVQALFEIFTGGSPNPEPTAPPENDPESPSRGTPSPQPNTADQLR